VASSDIDFAALTATGSHSTPPNPAAVEVAAVAPPPPTKKPLGEFTFHHKRSSSGNNFYVLGEIENTGEVPLDHPKLIVVLKDESGKEVGTDFGFAERDIIYPGQKSPISALVSEPPSHASMEYELVLRKATYFPSMVEGLKLDDPKVTRADWGSGFKAEGKVENQGSQPAKFVKIEAQGLDAEGKLLGLHTTYADGDVLAPGDSARFSFLSLYFDEEPAKYEFFVSGRVAN
jgi:hypothetical protein